MPQESEPEGFKGKYKRGADNLMKLKDYKGFVINVSEYTGFFTVDGGSKDFKELTECESHVDNIIKSESKKGLPKEAIWMHSGEPTLTNITSFNFADGKVAHTDEKGNKHRDDYRDRYDKKPNFIEASADNKAIVKQHHEIVFRIDVLIKEKWDLFNALSTASPIKFGLDVVAK